MARRKKKVVATKRNSSTPLKTPRGGKKKIWRDKKTGQWTTSPYKKGK